MHWGGIARVMEDVVAVVSGFLRVDGREAGGKWVGWTEIWCTMGTPAAIQ